MLSYARELTNNSANNLTPENLWEWITVDDETRHAAADIRGDSADGVASRKEMNLVIMKTTMMMTPTTMVKNILHTYQLKWVTCTSLHLSNVSFLLNMISSKSITCRLDSSKKSPSI